MTELGYALSSEEHGPTDLVEYATMAEDRGFQFLSVSDHYHPWLENQGHSPFVWNVLGGIAEATDDIEVGTGVTCPTIRIHPAIIAQATATSAAMLPDRFFFGVGTGENLNEHVLGDNFPPHHIRLEMLEEALEVIRELWTGEMHSHDGKHYTVHNAQIFTLPDTPPPIYVSGTGPKTAKAAGQIGDGYVGTSAQEDLIQKFEDAGGGDKPRYGQVTVCWGENEEDAIDTAYEAWANFGVPGELGQLLPTPRHFEQAIQNVRKEELAEHIVCGPDAQKHVEKIQSYVDAGYDHVYVHQVGPNQEGFFEFYEEEVLPEFS